MRAVEIQEFEGAVWVRINAPWRVGALLLVLPVGALFAWLSGQALAALQGSSYDSPLFDVLVILVVAAALAGPIWIILVNLGSTEVIEVSHENLRLSRSFFGLAKTRTFPLASVRNLRVDPRGSSKYDVRNLQIGGFIVQPAGSELIVFESGRESIQFGNGVEASVARGIVSTIRSHYPGICEAAA